MNCVSLQTLGFVAVFSTLVQGGILKNEDQCLEMGGICATNETCPEIHPTPHLCPQQEEEGGVCCRKIPTDVTDCRLRGGQCQEDCGRVARIESGECPAGMNCCLLIF